MFTPFSEIEVRIQFKLKQKYIFPPDTDIFVNQHGQPGYFINKSFMVLTLRPEMVFNAFFTPLRHK